MATFELAKLTGMTLLELSNESLTLLLAEDCGRFLRKDWLEAIGDGCPAERGAVFGSGDNGVEKAKHEWSRDTLDVVGRETAEGRRWDGLG